MLLIFQSDLTDHYLEKAEVLQSRLLTISERLHSIGIKLKYLRSAALIQMPSRIQIGPISKTRHQYLENDIEDIKFSMLKLKEEITAFKANYLSI
jgi:hypothetical protein